MQYIGIPTVNWKNLSTEAFLFVLCVINVNFDYLCHLKGKDGSIIFMSVCSFVFLSANK